MFRDIFLTKRNILSVFFLYLSTSWIIFSPVNSDAFAEIFPLITARTELSTFMFLKTIAYDQFMVHRPPVSMIVQKVIWAYSEQIASVFDVKWAFVLWLVNTAILGLLIAWLSFMFSKVLFLNKSATDIFFILIIFISVFQSSNVSYFHDPLQMAVILSWGTGVLFLISLFNTVLFIRSNKSTYLLIAVILNLLLINTYELVYPLNLLLIFYIFYSAIQQKVERFRISIYVLSLLSLFSWIYWILRFFSGSAQVGYSGLDANTNVFAISKALFIESFISVPLVSSSRNYLELYKQGNMYNFNQGMTFLSSLSILIILCSLVILTILLKKSRKTFEVSVYAFDFNSKVIFLLTGLAFLTASLNYAISTKYQNDFSNYISFYLAYPLGLIFFALLFAFTIIRYFPFRYSSGILLLSLLFNWQANFLAAKVSTLNFQANEVLVNQFTDYRDYTDSELCKALNDVRVSNYANLGDRFFRNGYQIIVSKRSDFICDQSSSN